MFRLFAILVRTSYLTTALIVLACGVYLLLKFLQSLFGPTHFGRDLSSDLLVVSTIVIFLLMPLRALARVFAQGELIPDSRLRARPIVASIVMVTCLLGSALFLLVARILLDVLPSESDVNFGGPLTLTLLSFAAGMLIGELVLVGGMRDGQANNAVT